MQIRILIYGHVESDVITECQVFFGFVEFSLPCTMLTVWRDTLFVVNCVTVITGIDEVVYSLWFILTNVKQPLWQNCVSPNIHIWQFKLFDIRQIVQKMVNIRTLSNSNIDTSLDDSQVCHSIRQFSCPTAGCIVQQVHQCVDNSQVCHSIRQFSCPTAGCIVQQVHQCVTVLDSSVVLLQGVLYSRFISVYVVLTVRLFQLSYCRVYCTAGSSVCM